jgi:hypothetical protein
MFKNYAVVEKLIKFCEAEKWSGNRLKKILKKPVNATQPNFKEKVIKTESSLFNTEELKSIRRTALLSEKYGYQL